ncbi:MAG: hypothetical protein R3B60_00850 [Candidatus Paceibacterota bacterium]
MRINNKTKYVFIISIVVVIVSASIFSFFLFFINKQGDRLEEKVSLLEENNKKEAAYRNITRTATETEEERLLLGRKFLKGNDDTIVFLSEIETLAPKFGLTFQTKALDGVVGKAGDQEAVKATFAYSGKKNSVLDFTKVMENLPYHSYIEALTLSEIEEGLWEGTITAFITTKSP